MENAAKALLIAGGVLIAILLLTLFSYLYTRMGESTSRIYEQMAETEINEFNQQFWNYNGLKDLSIQDVASVINLAKNSQKNGITVGVYLNSNSLPIDTLNIENLIKDNLEKKYKCEEVSVNTSTKYVNKIKFSEQD